VVGQRLGIKEVDDGILLANSIHYPGYFDLELKTLHGPFGTNYTLTS